VLSKITRGQCSKKTPPTGYNQSVVGMEMGHFRRLTPVIFASIGNAKNRVSDDLYRANRRLDRQISGIQRIFRESFHGSETRF